MARGGLRVQHGRGWRRWWSCVVSLHTFIGTRATKPGGGGKSGARGGSQTDLSLTCHRRTGPLIAGWSSAAAAGSLGAVGRSATTRQLGWEGEERGRAQSPTTHPWLQPGRATKTGPLGQRRSRCLRQGTSHHCVGLCRPPPDAASSGWVDRATWPEAVWSSTYGRGWLNVRHLLPTP